MSKQTVSTRPKASTARGADQDTPGGQPPGCAQLRDGRDEGQTFGDGGDRNTDPGGDGPGQGLAAQQGQPGHGGPAGQGDGQSAATMVVPS